MTQTNQVNDMKKVPIYRNTGEYAREHGELELFRASNRANLECRAAIEEAIGKNFDGMYLQKGAARPVIQEFGAERVLYVLANTVQRKDWDGRFSRDNKQWAQTVIIPADVVMGTDRRIFCVVESHPAVLDGFIHMAREEVKAMQKEAAKESVHEKLQKPSRPSHSQHTKKNPEMEL